MMFEVLGRLLYFLLHLSIDKSLSSGEAHPLMRRAQRKETKMPDPKEKSDAETAAALAREINSLGWPDVYDGLGVKRQTGETQTVEPISALPKGRSDD